MAHPQGTPADQPVTGDAGTGTTPASGTPESVAFPGFPPDFVWGVATAAYQIEGAVTEDGRGPSVWDTFCRRPGAIANGHTGDVACDHYHRWPEDLELIRDLGVGAYRFSVAWPRVQPDGTGPVNPRGMDFYSRLVDALLDAGITPFLTLYHWDLPQALEDRGGWRVRDTAERFAEYAALVHAALGDRVQQWTTLNEPFCPAFVGYAEGRHAPGVTEGQGALAAAHHLLVGHGLAVSAMRAQRHGDQRFGITLNLNDMNPASQRPEDLAAMRRIDCYINRTFLDPLLAHRYPLAEAETWPGFTERSHRLDGDLDVIGVPLDFLGVNTYFPTYAAAAPYRVEDPRARTAGDIGVTEAPPAHLPRTSMGWPVDPQIMERLVAGLRADYPSLPPVYVTENGAAFPDVVAPDGRVHDADRIAYLDGHLRSLHRAVQDGADVRGYFCWTLMDNFEWAKGYDMRFGLVRVDEATQDRTPKDSFAWYRDVVGGQAGQPDTRSRPVRLAT
jgi:beta-glucosidase